MKKAVISVLGKDKPGIIAAVSEIFYQTGCNIENISQTILQTEFAGIFIVSLPEHKDIFELAAIFHTELYAVGLTAYVKSLDQHEDDTPKEAAEPFIITTSGPDRIGLVAAITEILAKYKVNITNMKAVFQGGDDPNKNITIYEVDIPQNDRQQALYTELRAKASELNLSISIQHQHIFTAINRI